MKRTATIGIYEIKGPNGMRYIGQSIDCEQRWNEHCNALKLEFHDSPKMQEDYNSFGIDAFSFEIVEKTPHLSRKRRLDREAVWIDACGDKAYNIRSRIHFAPRKPITDKDRARWADEEARISAQEI